MKFTLIEHDEEVVKGQVYRFKIREENDDKTNDYSYFIDNQGFIYQQLDDIHSVALGLRTFINAPIEFQRMLTDCYIDFREKFVNLSVIDK